MQSAPGNLCARGIVNAVSSHRPHSTDGEYRRNQTLAKTTWDHVFQKITYCGPQEPELASYKTQFIHDEQFPRIRRLAELAGQWHGLTAILNADILVAPEILALERQMKTKRRLCASSRRWGFAVAGRTLAEMLEKADLGNDRGRDIFVATGAVWRNLAMTMPEGYRIGNPYWDAYVTDFFRKYYDASFVDFTSWRCVFHPEHAGRNYPFAQEIATLPRP